jgi:hypothetical protein
MTQNYANIPFDVYRMRLPFLVDRHGQVVLTLLTS